MAKEQFDTRTRILRATREVMEQGRGHGSGMSDIARRAGISRQAVYLHFPTRTDLLVATVQYVDQIYGIDEKMQQVISMATGLEQMELFVTTWAAHAPQIHGLGKSLWSARESDEAAAAAWDDRMGVLRGGCRHIIATLSKQGDLASHWDQSTRTRKTAADLFWTVLSLASWEQLVLEVGWTRKRYTETMLTLLRSTFLA